MKQHCKECRELKELTEYYKHPEWLNGVLWRCKECIKRWRRSEEERKKARVNDIKRSKDIDRIKYTTQNTKRWRMENPKKRNAHKVVNNYYRYHRDEQPKECFNCNSKIAINMHHEDYDKPNEIIPLCNLCHKWYHFWKIEINKTNFLIIPF